MWVWVGVLGGQVAVSCGAGDIYLVLGVVGHVGLSGGGGRAVVGGRGVVVAVGIGAGTAEA